LKEAAEFAAFGIASHVLQSIPVKEPVEIAVGQVHDIVGQGFRGWNLLLMLSICPL